VATILFVHGTGVRRDSYENTFSIIESRVRKTAGISDFKVERCLWGESHGSRLIDGGRSIPGFTLHSDLPDVPDIEDKNGKEILKWWLLCQNPSFQIDQLWEKRDQNMAPRPFAKWCQLRDGISNYRPSDKVNDILGDKLRDHWSESFKAVIDRENWVETTPDEDQSVEDFFSDFAQYTVESIIAELTLRALASGIPPLTVEKRGELISTLIDDLNARTRGVSDWFEAISKPMKWLLLKSYSAGDLMISGIVRRPVVRNFVTDNTHEAIGDILYYQVHGRKIRDFIASSVEKAEPPVFILAHSLGGIASVEMLVERNTSGRVAGLITAGSQSPLFYEMNCLATLERTSDESNPLPCYFPAWLNFYDQNDYLSYAAAPVFGESRVRDHQVISHQPRLIAHSAYWNQNAVWREIASFLTDSLKGVEL